MRSLCLINYPPKRTLMTLKVVTQPRLLAHLSRWLRVSLNSIGMILSPSVIVRRPQFQRSSSLKLRPIKLKFDLVPPWVVALKFCSRYHGHMTKMATAPICGKNPSKKSSSPEQVRLFPQNLVCSIGYSSPSYFAQMMTLR